MENPQERSNIPRLLCQKAAQTSVDACAYDHQNRSNAMRPYQPPKTISTLDQLLQALQQLKAAVTRHQIRYDEVEKKTQALLNTYMDTALSLEANDTIKLIKTLLDLSDFNGLTENTLKAFYLGKSPEKDKETLELHLHPPVDLYILHQLAATLGCRFYIPKPKIYP